MKETNQLIGVTGLVDVGRYDGYREIEVHICDQFNQPDYVTEAHKLILKYGFENLGLSVAFACVECDDQVSKQAMTATGFVCEGTLRKFGRDGKVRLRYSILKEEYQK